jgi:ketosteroid isomerase-like protein
MIFRKVKKYWVVLVYIGIIACKPGQEFHRAKLLKTDQSFSKYSEIHGIENAFLEYLAEDAVLLQANTHPIKGLDNIRKIYKAFDGTHIQLTWEPMDAVVSESGDLGYTYGIYTQTENGTGTKKGTYVSIWRIDNDDRWKLVLDTGNEGLGEIN